MNISRALAERLREVILYGTWIANTNFKNQLEDVSVEMATKTNGDWNSLAALTFHIHYYIKGILEVFEGKPLSIRDKYSFDIPPLQSEELWEALKESLWDDADMLAQCIEKLPEENWNHTFFDEKYGSYHRNIDGLIKHAYYHLGQVVLIKKRLA